MPLEESVCPICEGALSVRGIRKRGLMTFDWQKIYLHIRRLYCSKCRRIHHELPDCIVPYKRHCAETIENIIEGRVQGVPCDDGTIRRIKIWWRLMLPYFLSILLSLESKFGIEFPAPAPLKTIVRAVANSHHWVCTRSDCLSP